MNLSLISTQWEVQLKRGQRNQGVAKMVVKCFPYVDPPNSLSKLPYVIVSSTHCLSNPITDKVA